MATPAAVQRAIYSLEEGLGARFLRGVILLTVITAIFAAYAFSQFRGLHDPRAMEAAQLARRLQEDGTLNTRCIRPADTWLVRRHTGAYDPSRFPDVRNAPLYPALLSGAFRLLNPSFTVQPSLRPFEPETRAVVPIGILCTLAAGFLLYRLGRRLFDARIAFVAMLIYFLTHAVLRNSISGTVLPLATLVTTALLYAGHAAARPERAPLGRLAPGFVLAGVLCGLSFLTDYRLLVLLPVVLILWALRLERRTAAFLILVAVFGLVVCPWLIRNNRVCGSPLGMKAYELVGDSALYEDDAFDRQPNPELDNTVLVRAVLFKARRNLVAFYEREFRTLGSGLLICFFLVSFFHRFDAAGANALRWATLAGLLLLMGVCSLLGASRIGILNVFLPLVTLYGTAFFFVTIGRLEFAEAIVQQVLTWLLVLLAALPLVLTVLGPRAPLPYPPYFPPYISYACGMLEPEETLCTDIPWATAWYGNQPSILLPRSVADFSDLNESGAGMAGLYLTRETGNRPYTDAFVSGPFRSWLPVLNRQRPADFPLSHGIDIPPGTRDQLFLTDRIRWKEDRPDTLAEDREDGVRVEPTPTP